MSYLDLFIFFIGLFGQLKFKFGGDLFLADLLLAGSLLVFQGRILQLFRGSSGTILLMSALWMLGQVITDIYRETPFEDYSRGWAKIIFFVLDYCGLMMLSNQKLKPILLFISGLALSLIIQTLFFPNEVQGGENGYGDDFAGGPWKFGLGPGLTTLAAILGATQFTRRLFGWRGEYFPMAAMAVVNLTLNSRSGFGIAMGAVAFGLLKRLFDLSPNLRQRLSPLLFGFIMCGGALFFQGLIEVYSFAAESNWLGDRARDKYELQMSGDLGILQAGRFESLVSTRAILDSPVIGHGSWAKDPAYSSLLADLLEAKGVRVFRDQFEYKEIPSHSHLLGAWVEAGITGGVFWIFVLFLAIAALYRGISCSKISGVLIGFFMVTLVWDILFSPFANAHRFIKGAQICVALMIIRQAAPVPKLK